MTKFVCHCPRCKEEMVNPDVAPDGKTRCPACQLEFIPDFLLTTPGPRAASARRDAALLWLCSNIFLAAGALLYFIRGWPPAGFCGAVFFAGLFCRLIAELIRIRAALEK